MKKFLVVAVLLMASLCCGIAQAAQVPALINFQSLLFDDGGNAIPDGEANITFRITDISGSVLYEENQLVEVVKGAVSAMVGNGLDANGAPTGGVPAEVLDPTESRYLETIVDKYAQSAMEIVSVPYAIYAEKTMSAAPESIDGEAIAKKAITLDHFADNTMNDLSDALVNEADMVNFSTLQATTGASNVGVESGLNYSTGDNIQRVVEDLDSAIKQRQTADDSLTAAIDEERTTRITADSSEAQTRTTADQNHDNSISQLQTQVDNRVSRTGDQMNGSYTLCGDMTINCSGDLNVDGTNVGDAMAQYSTSINLTQSYFGGLKVIAWGVVDNFGNLIDGENASTTQNAIGKYTVSFIDPPSGANYAVVLNSTHVSDSSNVEVATYSKGSGSFGVHGWFDNGGLHPSNSSFDFVVLGRQ